MISRSAFDFSLLWLVGPPSSEHTALLRSSCLHSSSCWGCSFLPFCLYIQPPHSLLYCLGKLSCFLVFLIYFPPLDSLLTGSSSLVSCLSSAITNFSHLLLATSPPAFPSCFYQATGFFFELSLGSRLPNRAFNLPLRKPVPHLLPTSLSLPKKLCWTPKHAPFPMPLFIPPECCFTPFLPALAL